MWIIFFHAFRPSLSFSSGSLKFTAEQCTRAEQITDNDGEFTTMAATASNITTKHSNPQSEQSVVPMLDGHHAVTVASSFSGTCFTALFGFPFGVTRFAVASWSSDVCCRSRWAAVVINTLLKEEHHEQYCEDSNGCQSPNNGGSVIRCCSSTFTNKLRALALLNLEFALDCSVCDVTTGTAKRIASVSFVSAVKGILREVVDVSEISGT